MKRRWPLILGAAVLTLLTLFVLRVGHVSGSIAGLILVALIGVAYVHRDGLRLRNPASLASVGRTVLLATIPLMVGILAWRRVFTERLVGTAGDWGITHSMVQDLLRAWERGEDTPAWLMGVSTGDPSFELYPYFTAWLSAHLAQWFDRTDSVASLLVQLAVVVRALTATQLALIAARFGPWPIALALSLLFLVDGGDVYTGGTVAVLQFGLVHQAVALCLTATTFLAVLRYLETPTRGRSVAVWIATAACAVAHPGSLVALGFLIVGLLGSRLLAGPDRRARLASAGFHVVIGLLLGAIEWAPYAARVVAYGVHYSSPAESAADAFQHVLNATYPLSDFRLTSTLALGGGIAALLRRHPQAMVFAIIASAAFVLYVDAPYLDFGLLPGRTAARYSGFRMAAVVVLIVPILGTYAASILGQVRVASDPSTKTRFGAAAAVAFAFLVYLIGTHFAWHGPAVYRGLGPNSVPDPTDFEALASWVEEQERERDPTTIERLYWENGEQHWTFHLRAKTGVAMLYTGPVPQVFLRERLERVSPETLRRYQVRWVARHGGPPTLGDPVTQLEFGNYFVREVPGWDGRFARIEDGSGEIAIRHLENDRIALELRGASQPQLVTFGMGFYPRWRLYHEDGSVHDTSGHSLGEFEGAIAAAQVPPGRSELRCDGPLPSDHRGIPLFLLGIALGIASLTWPRISRWDRAQSLRTAFHRHRAVLPRYLLVASVAGLSVAAVLGRPGARGLAMPVLTPSDVQVEARLGSASPWSPCRFSFERLAYECPNGTWVRGAVRHVANDRSSSWPFSTPAVRLHGSGDVRLRFFAAEGDYLAGAIGGAGRAEVRIGERSPRVIYGTLNRLEVPPDGAIVEAVLTGSEAIFAFSPADQLLAPEQSESNQHD